MIELKGISKSYGRNLALNNINLTINQGEIIGLFGENGAGKTTLLKSILNFISYEGTITLDGEPITRKNIGRLSFATCEHSFFADLSAKEHMNFYKEHFSNFNEKRFHGLMDFFELPTNRKIGQFSTGQQNQFEVIMALSQGADYILMDEPFAGNDVFNREDFYKLLLGILNENETILLSTHLIEEVSNFISRAVLINKGNIVSDIEKSSLDEKGISLIDYVKESYHYRTDRIINTISEINGQE